MITYFTEKQENYHLGDGSLDPWIIEEVERKEREDRERRGEQIRRLPAPEPVSPDYVPENPEGEHEENPGRIIIGPDNNSFRF